MKFGLIVSKQHPPGVSMVERFREHIDQVRAARDAGFDLIVMGQHYLSTPFQEIQTMPGLARLAAGRPILRQSPGSDKTPYRAI
jgi:alkanesulfonate monooxygenase SsuD/methylene tetrahydromethanopterin reductase-like flavin-dependent oxidoreductase (luciferase family)